MEEGEGDPRAPTLKKSRKPRVNTAGVDGTPPRILSPTAPVLERRRSGPAARAALSIIAAAAADLSR